jgi:diaminopimelate decarboxylase
MKIRTGRKDSDMPWWENETFRARNGRLEIAGRPAESLASRFGTPVYVYGRERIRANTARLKAAFAAAGRPVRFCYAMKANPHPGILSLVRSAGGWIDAVSPFEVAAALSAGFPASRVLFTGTSLSEADLRAAFAVEGLVVNIDALEQIELMARVRSRWFKDRRISVSIRWNPGIGRGFNPKAVTAGERNAEGTPVKFGIEEAKVLPAFRAAAAAGFRPVGLHQHLGSGWTAGDYPAVAEAVDRMAGKAAEVEAAGFKLAFTDFGGGFGPRYSPGQRLFPLDRYARRIGRALRAAGVRAPRVLIEPGKFLVADAGAVLLRVSYVKRSYGNIFACVDGGTFNTVPRPAIYTGAAHHVLNASRLGPGRTVPVTIAGHLCETGDVFGKDIAMVEPRSGDVLAVLTAGAYARSMASNFNLRPIPGERLL